ncbi:hypothetical protein EXIGLDRAFT_380845 [Exidia glandulosa HHB12029]|uniref:Uncharacterized protein n=1 Tax=Exidia glandulosa HHB12029 TaxID=1314781 RepID=A0A165BZU8_EXIGL|nr:hypothetical protein EXIGLDRAFT_380845 [Exidia glandulosa HHB12029]
MHGAAGVLLALFGAARGIMMYGSISGYRTNSNASFTGCIAAPGRLEGKTTTGQKKSSIAHGQVG